MSYVPTPDTFTTIPEPEQLLPQTVEELDAFVASITDQYKLPEGDDTYDAIATLIMHLPHTKAFSTRSYFGNAVRKSIANKAAYTRLRELADKRKASEENKQAELSLVPQETDATCEQPLQNA